MALPSQIAFFSLLGAPLMLVSCVSPKAVAIAEQAPVTKPAPTTKVTKPVETSLPQEKMPTISQKNDGIRMPDMLGLPTASELRSVTPVKPTSEATSSGAITTKPPVEPAQADQKPAVATQ